LDSHGRVIRDLRLSITDKCNFRCVYCMEPDVRFMPADELLAIEEMARLARVCVGLGVEKVRVTGGEPTVHPDLTHIIASLAGAGASDLAMTTNGSLMDERSLTAWRTAGLNRLTVSIDSLDPARFTRMTRSKSSPAQVVAGIRAAKRAGFHPVKINAVVVRGLNEDDVPMLAALARELDVDMRYIEFMPLDSGHTWDSSKLVPASEIVDRISQVYPLVPIERDEPSSTSLLYSFADGAPGRIGVIAPVTRSFCGECARLRITADGKVRPCLFSTTEWDIRPLLRGGASDAELARFLIDATWTKQVGHGISSPTFEQPSRPMSAIGG
jgi:cyclic pyranopterin phosphate synthase